MFSIITPCSRKENLSSIYNDIKHNSEILNWFIVYDSNTKTNMFNDYWIREDNIEGGVTGSAQRNLVLDLLSKIDYGDDIWVYFLDDDNLLHPNMITTVNKYIKEMPDIMAFTFNQDLDNSIRIGSYNNIRVTHIDTAQYIINLKLIKNNRFIHDYCADGYFIESIYNDNKNKFFHINETLSYYNKLRK